MKEIPLTQGKVALVDAKDYSRVAQHSWYADRHENNFYAACRIEGRKTYLHNFVLGERGVHHKDGNGLINCRHNLVPATQQENSRAKCRKAPGATSQYRGVSWLPRLAKWHAQIYTGQRQCYLGVFKSEVAAARAYDAAASKFFGEFAALNFPVKRRG